MYSSIFNLKLGRLSIDLTPIASQRDVPSSSTLETFSILQVGNEKPFCSTSTVPNFIYAELELEAK